MTRVTHTFPDLELLGHTLEAHRTCGSLMDRDRHNRCEIKVAGCSYTVDFAQRTVTTTWKQKVKNFFASRCCGAGKTTAKDLKNLLFVFGPHYTEPHVAAWVFRRQMEREGVAIPTPEYDWLGEAQPPSGKLTTFKQLGTGTFAIVDAVVWGPKAGPLMARKMGKTPKAAANIVQEQALLARLNHANIIHCYPGATEDRSMVMDDGGVTLFDLCDNELFEEPRGVLLSCCTQLLSALAYLHERNIVHRDVKSTNILVNPGTRHQQLVDFGLATDLGPTGQIKESVGSLYYMAPEVFFRVPYRTEPDIYSAGCTLYEVFCGSMLRDKSEVQRGIYLSRDQLAGPLHKCMQMVSKQFNCDERETLAELLCSMLDPNPTTRITAHEALEILASFDRRV